MDANAPGGTPFNVFLNNRGAQFQTPGTGFVQAPEAGGANGGLETFFTNPTYGATFNTFSPNRLFTPVGSNLTDAIFFIPGSNGGVPAQVAGFGAVFTDVDLPSSSMLEFFDVHNNLLASRNILPGTVPDGSLSFLGVIFDAGEQVARVHIISGNAALGANANDNPAGGVDIVAMDDFLFSEPHAASEPSAAFLASAALILLAIARRRNAAGRGSS